MGDNENSAELKALSIHFESERYRSAWMVGGYLVMILDCDVVRAEDPRALILDAIAGTTERYEVGVVPSKAFIAGDISGLVVIIRTDDYTEAKACVEDAIRQIKSGKVYTAKNGVDTAMGVLFAGPGGQA